MEIIPMAAMMAEKLGSRLNPLNPIHTLFFRELPYTSAETIATAYRRIGEVFDLTAALYVMESASGQRMTPMKCLSLIQYAMRGTGLKFTSPDKDFIEDPGKTAAEKIVNGVLDCWPSSLVRLTVSHEMGWPVHMVVVPKHAIVRWDDGNERINSDYGSSYSDEAYAIVNDISQAALEDGVYLKSLDRVELEGLYISLLDTEGVTTEEGMALTEKALELNPRRTRSWAILAQYQYRLRRFEEALASISKAEFYEPDDLIILNWSANIHKKVGDKSGAFERYARIVEISSKLSDEEIEDAPDDLFTYGWANFSLGNHNASIDWFTKALAHITETKVRSYAHMNRGTSKVLTWGLFGGLMDYVKGGYFYLKYLGERFFGTLKRVFR